MTRLAWTVGHSNRSFRELATLLTTHSIELVADVRRFNGSLRHPQFGRDALAPALAGEGIGYRHFEALGGRRGRGREGSPNRGWRVESFNAYADWMSTPTFEEALADLIRVAEGCRTALLCSEALPWRCHRRLIADALTIRGWSVLDIIGPGKVAPHELTPFARNVGNQLTYPAEHP